MLQELIAVRLGGQLVCVSICAFVSLSVQSECLFVAVVVFEVKYPISMFIYL